MADIFYMFVALLFSCSPGVSQRRVTGCKNSDASGAKDMDYIIGGLTTVLLFAYLVYALLKPEKF